MATILNIETSTRVCSVALTADGQTLHHAEDFDGPLHATLLGRFVDDALHYARSHDHAVDAVAVSIGPGSYTGLRIGLSMAKGLAYGLQVPLITVGTLELLAVSAMFSRFFDDDGRELLYVPMLDARRMEVYTAVYNAALTPVVPPCALVLDNDDTLRRLADDGRYLLVVCGDGSDKAQTLLSAGNVVHVEGVKPLAIDMTALSEKAFREQRFADVAYCTPAYLKEYRAGRPHNKVLDAARAEAQLNK